MNKQQYSRIRMIFFGFLAIIISIIGIKFTDGSTNSTTLKLITYASISIFCAGAFLLIKASIHYFVSLFKNIRPKRRGARQAGRLNSTRTKDRSKKQGTSEAAPSTQGDPQGRPKT